MVYEHTPFVEFEKQVHQLCREIWPQSSPEDILIERMMGGSYNRVIGISIKKKDKGYGDTQSPPYDNYVLRIPRFEDAHLDNQIGTLAYVRTHSDLPVPKVIAYDLSPDNVLGSPYLLQTRMDGVSLQKVYMSLNHLQKCGIAREFARILCEIRALSFPSAGIICTHVGVGSAATELGDEEVGIQHFRIFSDSDNGSDSINGTTNDQHNQTPLDMISFQFDRWKRIYLQADKPDTVLLGHMDRLLQLAKAMDELNCLPNEAMTMCHLDLCPRNILIQIPTENDSTPPRISGVLDWDDAIIAPSYMSCIPPSWLWQWSDDDEEEDESTAGDTPEDPEMRDIKQVFDNAVDSQFTRLCYPAQYRMARKLTRFAILGLHTMEDLRESDALVAEWGELCRGLASMQG